MATALVSILPVALVARDQQLHQLVNRLEPWAIAVVLSVMLQMAYVVYLFQIPDRSALRVIAALVLLHASAYAVVMALLLLSSPNNWALQQGGLAAARFTRGQEASWCLIMVLLYSVLSYLAWRIARRWRE